MDDLLPLTLAVIILFLSYSLFFFFAGPRNPKPAPEAGRSWPVIGHLLSLAGPELPHLKISAMADRYGPMFMLRIGLFPTLVVNTSELAKELFTTHDAAISARADLTASTILSNNGADFAFAPHGEFWRRMRKITAVELMSSRRLDLLQRIRTSEVGDAIGRLYELWEKEKEKNGGEEGGVSIQMNKWFGDVILNVILRMVAGKRYVGSDGGEDGGAGEGREAERCRKLMREFFRRSGLLVVRDLFPFLGFLDVGGHEKATRELNRELNDLAGEWIEEHRSKRRRRRSCGGGGDDEQEDFIDVLLSVLKEVDLAGHDLDTVCKSTVRSLIVGATDTTMGTLVWALSLLLNHPGKLEKVVEEIDTVVGKERAVDESDIDELPYFQATMKEVMRLNPSAATGGPREFSRDCTVAGHHVPAGTRLVVNVHKIQRDPKVWPEPTLFKPERFLVAPYKDVDVKGKHFELIPFGAGRRSCPGINFGIQMTHLALARFLQAFEVSRPSDAPVDMTGIPGLTVSKATPLEVLVSPRLPASLYQS